MSLIMNLNCFVVTTIIIGVFGVTAAAEITQPTFFNPCKSVNNPCVKEQAQRALEAMIQGIPQLGLLTLDPLHINKTSLSLPGLNLNLKDLVVKGFRKAVIDFVIFDLSKNSIYLDVHSDFVLKSKYEVDGKITILPIKGKGDAKFTLENLNVKTSVGLGMIQKDGVAYLQVKDTDYTFEVKKRATFALTNLFDGNEALAKPMLNFMNQNWRLMIESFGDEIFRPVYDIILDDIKIFLERIPLKYLILDYEDFS